MSDTSKPSAPQAPASQAPASPSSLGGGRGEAHAEQLWALKAQNASALEQAHDFLLDETPVDRYDLLNANLHFGSSVADPNYFDAGAATGAALGSGVEGRADGTRVVGTETGSAFVPAGDGANAIPGADTATGGMASRTGLSPTDTGVGEDTFHGVDVRQVNLQGGSLQPAAETAPQAVGHGAPAAAPQANADAAGDGSGDPNPAATDGGGTDDPEAPPQNAADTGTGDSGAGDNSGSGDASGDGGVTDDGSLDNSDPVETNSAPTDILMADGSVMENSAAGTYVGELSAVDADTGDTFTYEIVGGDAKDFVIVDNRIYVREGADLDYETATGHDIDVRVTDSSGNSYTETLTITVENESPVIIGTPNEDALTGTDEEDRIEGLAGDDTLVGGVGPDTLSGGEGSDTADYSGSDEPVSIDLKAGTGSGGDAEGDVLHSIENATGTIGDDTLSGSGADNLLDGGAGNDSLSGGAGDDTFIGGAGDDTVDGGAGEDTLQLDGEQSDYAIVRNPDGSFTIVDTREWSPDGTDTVSNVENLEFSDGTVDIDDADYAANNAAPTDILVDGTDVDENSASGTVVGQASAVDDGDDRSHVYSLTNDAGGAFTIDPDTGVITVADGTLLDAEAHSSLDITVQVTDSGGKSYEEVVSIAINDVNEAGVSAIDDIDPAAARLDENVAIGTPVGITAQATDADATDTVTYSLSDDGDGLFAIDPDTGVVTVAGDLSYEDGATRTIEVTATSSDGSTSVQSYDIEIGDVAENLVLGDGDDSFTDTAVTELSIDAGGGDDTVIGSAGDDVISGGTGSDSLSGGEGSDSLYGGDGKDALDGGAGNDVLDGGAGNDTLTGGAGDDTIDGGAGNDDVIFSGNWSDYTITYDADDETYTVADNRPGSPDGTDTVTGVETFHFADQTITVSDPSDILNDGPTGATLSADTIDENSAEGTTVGTVTAVDPDSGDSHTYALVDDAGGAFAIDENSGEITVADSTLIDYENASSMDITVRVTDAAGATHDEVLTINLNDIDEFDVTTPVDTDTAVNVVDEGAATGASVGIVASAQDADGTNNSVTYSLVDADGNPVSGGAFAIDENSGEITVADGTQLDHESAASETVFVKATSSDGSTSVQNFTIDVADVNDNAATFTSGTDAAADEDATTSDVLYTATATDPDASDTLTYSLSDDAGGLFTIDADTGEVTLADGRSLDYETATSHDITVEVSDGTHVTAQTVTIDVNDVNEASVSAVSDTDASANAVDEGVAVGTVVGITAMASDADGTDSVTYSLSDDAGGLFAIDANTGVVTVAGDLDAETAASHTIEVTATSSDGSTSVQNFTVAVNDVNETALSAVSDSDAGDNAVSEDATVGTAVGVTAFATDADATDTVTYSLSSNPGGFFAIDANTGVVTVAGDLDAETAASHTIEVTATSSDGSTSVQNFTIDVADVNDNAATFTSGTDAAADEDATTSDVLYTATATDPDASDTLTYSLSDDAGGLFTIDADTGEVTLADGRSLDYETATSHDITVEVSDGTHVTAQTVTIDVNDVNEASVSAVSDTDASANAVDEGVAVGTVVGITAMASDADGTDSVTYSLSDDAGGLFAIDANTGVVTVAGDLDAETAASHTIEVTATSSDGSTSVQNFTVAVNDVNETALSAVSDSDAGDNAVSEDAAVGTAVGVTAFATDADATDTVTYSLSSNPGGFFAIDANTGVVTVAGDLDAETAASHTIEVTATSSDGSTSVQNFTIDVADVNDNAATFTSGTDAAADEDATTSDVLYTATATDPDASDTLTYSLSDDAGGLFTIDADTGEVTLADGRSLDYETATSHDITVEVSDGTHVTAQTVTIDVNDVNEASVSAVSDTDASANAVDEGVAVGTVVGITAMASDADGTDSVTYSLSDDAGGLFAIDANTGVVTVAGDLDAETAASHTIEVTATSSDGSTSVQNFTVAVNDVNETALSAVSDSDAGDNAVSEDAAVGTAVGVTAFATDADATDTVTYSLSSNPGGFFAIDANTGVVTVAGDLDAETAASHTIEVTATSSDGSTSVQNFTIDVADVNDNAATFTSGTDAAADEDATTSDVLYTATATDPDASDTLTYSLSDDAGGLFTIDADTGEVTLADGRSLDYETATSHDITVEVSDGTHVTAQTVTIDVNDVYENVAPTDMTFGRASPEITTDSDGNEIIAANTVVASVASVADQDGGESYTYSLGDDANGTYQIDAATGEISLVADHDASTPYSDTVDVRVTDSAGNTYTETLGITLGTSGAEGATGTANTDIMYGFDGNDTLDGGAGDDILVGGDVSTIGASNTVGSSYSLIHLGTMADVDPNENNSGSENAADLIGTYGGSGNPLYEQIVAATANDVDQDGTVADDDRGRSAETFTINGVDHALDSTQVYDATVTFADGTSGTFSAVVVQMDNGDVYLAPEYTNNADAELLTSNPITSISLDSVNLDSSDLFTERVDANYAVPSDDSLVGGAGDDTLVGGAGADTLVGGDGSDTVDYSDASGGVAFSLSDLDHSGIDGEYAHASAGGYAGDADGDTFSGVENAIGSDYDDTVGGGEGSGTYDLGSGNDIFDNNETFTGSDTVYGGAGNDSVWTGDGDDILSGGDGADRLYGEAGNDTFLGGAGDDTLSGGSGSDVFMFAEGDGHDDVFGGAGGSWVDTIDLSDGGAADLGTFGTDWTVTITSGSIESQDSSSITLSDDASGTITLQDGSQMDFNEIERIEW